MARKQKNAVADLFATANSQEERATFEPALGSDALTRIHRIASEVDAICALPLRQQVVALNRIKELLHEKGPFRNEPVDLVRWVPADLVQANDYNPNAVAPPEMKLLEVSILADGYTQPIVTAPEESGKIPVVDGFHRNRVGKESLLVRDRVRGFLPIVRIRPSQEDRGDRIASTIRHNRARGKHQVNAMSDIVLELKNRNWTNERIAKELGMDEDEILRLCQITGLASLFKDAEFSKSWNIEDTELDIEFDGITDELEEEERKKHRTANTSDPERVFHTFDKWECHRAGFYESSVEGKTAEQCERIYADFLSNLEEFRAGLEGVTREWVNSCEHYLTNKAMNRIAWLGQASACYLKGIPHEFRSGFQLLSEEQKEAANRLAYEYLCRWLSDHGKEPCTFEDAMQIERQIGIY